MQLGSRGKRATCTQGVILVNDGKVSVILQHYSPHQHTQAYYPTTGRNGRGCEDYLLALFSRECNR